jgi:hypothetical protein
MRQFKRRAGFRQFHVQSLLVDIGPSDYFGKLAAP